jgi:hypothetical protein
VVGGDEGEWEVEVQGRVKWVVVSLSLFRGQHLLDMRCFWLFLGKGQADGHCNTR